MKQRDNENVQEDEVKEMWFGPLIDSEPEELANVLLTPEKAP